MSGYPQMEIPEWAIISELQDDVNLREGTRLATRAATNAFRDQLSRVVGSVVSSSDLALLRSKTSVLGKLQTHKLGFPQTRSPHSLP